MGTDANFRLPLELLGSHRGHLKVGSTLKEVGFTLLRELLQLMRYQLKLKPSTVYLARRTELVICVSDVGDIWVYKRPPAVVLETDDL